MNIEDYIGEYFKNVTLETCKEKSRITRPRVKPIDQFDESVRVEFPRTLRELFPLGTRYKATVKICQKTKKNGEPYGKPYLYASDIVLIADSVPDKGLIAKVKAGTISGRAYIYDIEETY
ncbi:MAG: hypothetical protein N0C91_08145 [Candidatus Thiodiazotropha endolucinida]|nr:hypothetical protein [Candidatus Thiodiazotropha taylori]MCW4261082.1 hypothetical protein [Candidatus Thiodiazotropha endolucinida]MCG8102346.1 hypothetical protein [Candidatus Thiodiazotropha taylori]MCG8120892.1 hypothetical protein [Candidatus Thiodiazotropha taylori]MCW4287669.1 hypothetical protein [Candidatus Thiodiazotropha endolucinida]